MGISYYIQNTKELAFETKDLVFMAKTKVITDWPRGGLKAKATT